MKIALSGKIRSDVQKLARQLKRLGTDVVTKKPDMVITFGGDGSFLWAERRYPGVPKLLVRNKSICFKCNEDTLADMLHLLNKKEHYLHVYPKLEVRIRKGKQIIKKFAANDVVIRNRDPHAALRFRLWMDGQKLRPEIIGDGIVVSTPFGSTGYYYSITRNTFKKGIGVAFNNTTRIYKPIQRDNPIIKLRVERSPAVVCTDNDPHIISISKGDAVEVRKSKQKFKLIVFKKDFKLHEGEGYGRNV
ncbi:MAG: hypothetical protein ABIH34_01170 [Nanoarchaeota archaeon]